MFGRTTSANWQSFRGTFEMVLVGGTDIRSLIVMFSLFDFSLIPVLNLSNVGFDGRFAMITGF